jgi:nicotinate-nucleotide pyrophosphorylase (carboxylating)
MDRNALKNLTHNAKDFLHVTKNDYKQWVFRYTFLELEKDLGERGDVTSESVIKGDVVKEGVVLAEEDGVLAGIEEIKYFLVDSDPRFKPRVGELSVEFFKKDGEKIKKGDKVLSIKGNVKDILAVERVVLNLLMRMSGVASYVAKLVKIAPEILITPTRKTLWGLLDKKACSVGGGGTHRLNLSDAILVKDNHLKVLGGSITTAVKNIAEKKSEARFVEIEVENVEDAILAAESLATFIKIPSCVLFDNMKPADIAEALKTIKDKGYYDKILFEASGGITEDNLAEYAKTGVDVVSMGCLTMRSGVLNFTLDLK